LNSEELKPNSILESQGGRTMKTLNTRWTLIALGTFTVLITIWAGSRIKANAEKAHVNGAALCVKNEQGLVRGALSFRTACDDKELQLATFENQKLTFTVPLNISTSLGVPALVERSDQTTYQTPMFEATTDPNGTADIIDGVIEEGSVYHHHVTLIARTIDGRAALMGWGYLVARKVGSQNIDLFSTLETPEQGSINPAPTSEVLAVGDRRILRVHGNGQDTLQWSAVVQRVKIMPPGQ
jgi:hypothetical protein